MPGFDVRRFFGLTLSGVAVAVAATGAVSAEAMSLRLIGTWEIPTGTIIEGEEFGGLSAIDQAPDGNFLALSDDRGGEGGTPRFYALSLDYDAEGFRDVSVLRTTNMLREDGTAFPTDRRTVDPEGLRLSPAGTLYWSSEGNFDSDPEALQQPFLREMTLEGEYVRDFAVPGQFTYFDGETAGARGNKSFEALAVAPDGKVFVANEDALVEDGPITTLEAGSRVRVTRFDPETGRADAQYAYALPPIPLDARFGAPFAPDYGLPELLALPDGSFLALERGFAWGVGNTIRIVHAAIGAETTDILGTQALEGVEVTPMSREVLLEMGPEYQGVKMDNMEAMARGPDLPNGNATLVLVSDNNFNGAQRTLFMAFEVAGMPGR